MLDDLTKTFFDTFGIETEERFYCKKGYCNQNPSVKENSLKCRECENGVYYIFPEITDSHYLKMICLIAEKLNCFTSYDIDYKNLKEYILKEMILEKDYFDKQQVQSLFKEG